MTPIPPASRKAETMSDKPSTCPECDDTGMVWTDGCNCGVGERGDSRYGMHERDCGAEPCPAGCPVMSDAELLARITAKAEENR